jgi:acetylornithine deacetylase/succinyl-diaminopimelate desuccinylase-like protein
MYKNIRQEAQSCEKELIQFTRKLVKTSSESLKESCLAILIKEKMEELNYEKVFCDDYGNVIGIFLGREFNPTLLLTSHMDTVPIIDTNQIPGTILNGKLFGRGASDCKSGLASQIFAGNVLKRTLLNQTGNLIVAGTIAEESGCSIGVKHLIEKTLPTLHLKPTYVILGEPTDLGVYYGHDGWVTLDIKIGAKNCQLIKKAVKAISKYFEESISHDNSSNKIEKLNIHEPLYKRNNIEFSVNLEIDRRLNLCEDEKKYLQEIIHSASQISQTLGVEMISVMVKEEIQNLPNGHKIKVRKITYPWAIDPFGPLMEQSRYALSSAGCKVKLGKWQLKRLCMGTAGSVLTREFNIPTIGYGPGSEELAHTENEFVEIKNITEALIGTTVLAQTLVGNTVFDWH